MSNWRCRAERRAVYEAEHNECTRRQAVEAERKAKLSMWGRIEEAATIEDVKEILHRLAGRLSLE
jgi:hypothetical protein